MSPYVAALLDRPTDHKQFVVLLGMDALRAVMGLKPRNFTMTEIIQSLQKMEATKD